MKRTVTLEKEEDAEPPGTISYLVKVTEYGFEDTKGNPIRDAEGKIIEDDIGLILEAYRFKATLLTGGYNLTKRVLFNHKSWQQIPAEAEPLRVKQIPQNVQEILYAEAKKTAEEKAREYGKKTFENKTNGNGYAHPQNLPYHIAEDPNGVVHVIYPKPNKTSSRKLVVKPRFSAEPA